MNRGFLLATILLALGSWESPAAAAQAAHPRLAELRVDDLGSPLGLDDPTPRFSWQLRDAVQGARQSAYQVDVFASPGQVKTGKPDWSSGRVNSAQSLNVRCGGPGLEPSHRYAWRVKVWVSHGSGAAEAAPISAVATWETGLLHPEMWRADWIGYETVEEAAVRHAQAMWIASAGAETAPRTAPQSSADQAQDAAAGAGAGAAAARFAFRQTVTLEKPVARATLYATGQDTVSAWINGHPVLAAQPFPPWKQLPWKKFVQSDATSAVVEGADTVAIEAVHYLSGSSGAAPAAPPPAVATLFVEFTDGTAKTFSTGSDWKAAANAPQGWQRQGFDDSAWKPAQAMKEPAGNPWIPDSVKALRHSFEVKSPVISARLYATALGAYEIFLNGKRVGDNILAPGWTDYRQTVRYQTFDVTSLVASGPNQISALLAPGWYSTPLEWVQQPNNYGETPPALRAQLRLEHADGSVEWIVGDKTWLASVSYIRSAELYDGETQDGQLKDACANPENAAAECRVHAAVIVPNPVAIEAQDFEPIRMERILAPVSMTEPAPGVYVYDFGQNFSGVERLRVSGPRGTDVRVRFAEIVNSDGTIYTDNLRTAKATDNFILAGSGVEELTPQFTFHGFRYMEVSGLSAPPGNDAVSAIVFHTDAPFTSRLATGSAMVNQLWKNILWGQRSNFVGIPTDCPQRDERLGWMADAQVFWRTASYNMSLAAFSRKFSADMRGTQIGTSYYGIYSPGTSRPNMGAGAGWSDAGVIIPWTSWLQTGDTQIVDDNWAAMQKYLDAIEAANPDGLWTRDAGIPFGDWLAPEGRTDYGLIATAYWAYDATLMRQMAHATGRKADEQKYTAMFDKVRAAFAAKYVRADGFVAGADNSPSPFGQIDNPNARSSGSDTQTGYVLALHMNLLPEALRAQAASRLAAKIEANGGLLGTGFLGTPYLLEELTRAGYARLAFKLLLNTEYPSWGYLVGHGATTMWERWNGDRMKSDPSMNSYNHYAYGAVADWIYRYAAGVDATPLDAGFHTVVLHPVFDARLGSLVFDYDSPYGPVHSDWTATGNTAQWHLTLPANTSGWLPLSASEAGRYRLNGAPLRQSASARPESRDGKPGYSIAAGKQSFSVTF